jgi:hypothetical protein
MILKEITKLFGPGKSTVSVHEKIISALAGLVGIGLIWPSVNFF